MKRIWLLTMVIALVMAVLAGINCGDDDDDDDDDNVVDDDAAMDDDVSDDDAADDDNTDDDAIDDDTMDDDCQGYDLIIEGETEMPSGTAGWTAYLNIDIATGDIGGIIDPDAEDQDPYDVDGFRHDATTGELDGHFPTPNTIPPAICEAETVYNHIDFTVVEGEMEGDVTFYCGEPAPETELFTVPATGTVTCGDFAM